ncbi:MAG: SDR family oxidoreductase [Myxococcales bacterium]|nr:SDR family oxidoreductase [Myxococcales bacterium]
MNIQDLAVIVTGGASGMGKHFTLRLAEGGANVLAVDVNQEALAVLTQEGAGKAGTIATRVCNVANEEDVVSAVNDCVTRFGKINGVVNNAGIFRDALLVKPDKDTGRVQRMSLKHWQAVIDVDLTGPFLFAREVAAAMVENGWKPGVIVNISSVSRHGNAGQGNYSAAKAGLVADTKLWATELARYGIRVGAVAPGFVDTPILQGMRPEVLDKMLAGVPLRRVGTPEEIYRAIQFIIECDYFTGRCIDVDGGLTM